MNQKKVKEVSRKLAYVEAELFAKHYWEGEPVLPELDAEADYPCLIDLNAADDGNDRNCMDELLAAEIVYELKDNYICKLLKRKPVKQELTEDLCPDLGSIDDYEWDDEDETDDCNTEVIQLVSDPDFEAYLAEQRKKQTNV